MTLSCRSLENGFEISGQAGRGFSATDPGCPEAVKHLIGRLMDLNRATGEDLALLPGIGPVNAARILEGRDANQGFSSMAQARRTPELSRTALESLERWAYAKDSR